MSRSSSRTTTEFTTEVSPSEGLEDEYKGIRDLKEHVNSQSTALIDHHANQQDLVFTGVTKGDLEKMSRQRSSIGRYTD